jgi:hypothetical protein
MLLFTVVCDLFLMSSFTVFVTYFKEFLVVPDSMATYRNGLLLIMTIELCLPSIETTP